MTAFFSVFPKIAYNGKVARNIILKSQFFRSVLSQVDVFYPYVIKDHERADTIAYNYYGDSDYIWLVYFSNEIVDPYFQWPMNNADFEEYIVKKYADIPTAQSTIVHYKYDPTVDPADAEAYYRKNYKLSVDSYNAMTTLEKSYWDPVYAFDNEFNINESRRNIRLFNNDYLPRVEQELVKIFK